MVREPDATMRPAPQDNQLMSKHRVLSFKPQLRLEWRGQDDQNETEQPNHSASLGDSITSSTRMRFSLHTGEKSLNSARQRAPARRWRGQHPFLVAGAPSIKYRVPPRSAPVASPAKQGHRQIDRGPSFVCARNSSVL